MAISDYDLETRAVRGGIHRSSFGETSEPIFLTSGFVYDSAESAEARFTGSRARLCLFALRQSNDQRF